MIALAAPTVARATPPTALVVVAEPPGTACPAADAVAAQLARALPSVAVRVGAGEGTPAPRGWRLELETAALLATAPRTAPDGSATAGGVTVRLLAGGPHLGATLAIGATTPSTLELGAARASELRLPFDVGVRASIR